MNTPRSVRITILLLGLAGASLFATLMLRHGVPQIVAAIRAAGWGVALVTAFHIVPLFCDVLGWRVLIPPEHHLTLRRFFLIRWIGDSVSAMLPVAHVGGEIVRVRLAAASGVPLSLAGASVLVGITISIATQIIFALTGLGLLTVVSGRAGNAAPVIIGSVIGVLVLGIFYAVQHYGIFRLAGSVVAYFTKSDTWRGLLLRGEVIDREIHTLYARRRALVFSALWTFATWTTGAAEVWIALRVLGHPSSYAQAYVIESMVQSIRSVMFLVPGALGVQEGGFLGAGLLLGIPPQTLLALSLVRRARELAFGVPGVIAWQAVEGRFLWRRPTAAAAAVPADPDPEPPEAQ